MFRIKINRELCKSCGLCIKFCGRKLLALDTELNRRGVTPAKFEETDGKTCSGCGNCAVICPDAAIEIDEIDDTAAAAQPKKKPARD